MSLPLAPQALVPGIILAALLSSSTGDKIVFSSTIAEALAAGKKQKRLVVVVVTAEYAQGSSEFAADCLQDPRLVELSRKTVNVRFDLDSASDACRTWVSKHLLKGEERVLEAPQLLFLDSDGDVHSACAGRMVPGQAEWAWLSALLSQDDSEQGKAKTGKTDLGERVRPPSRLKRRRVFSLSNKQAPPSKAEIQKLEERLKKTPSDYPLLAKNLVRSRSLEVIKIYESACAWYPAKGWMGILRKIEARSPREWSRFVKMALRNPDPDVRMMAARSAEVLAGKAALPMLLKVHKKEKILQIRIAQLRALVATAPNDRKVQSTLLKALKNKSRDYRIAATRLLLQLDSLKAVEKGLVRALADKKPAVREAAAEVVGARRNPALVPVASAALKKEQDEDVKEALQEAIDVARKGIRG